MSKMQKYSVWLLLLALFAVSCKQEKRAETTSTNFRIAVKKDPKKLHPLIYPTESASIIYNYIFLPLADFDPKTFELKPVLCKALPEREIISEGDKKGYVQYTFEILEEAVWNDGSPIDGEDYVFTLKAILHPETAASSYRGYFSSIDEVIVDAINPKKVKVILDEPYMLDKEIVSNFQLYPQHVYDSTGILNDISISDITNKEKITKILEEKPEVKAFAQAFNSVKYSRETIEGAGPYIVKEWITDQLVILERKENYWGKGMDRMPLQAAPKEISFYIIPDELAIMNQLKAGNIDFYPKVSAQAFLEIKANETDKENFQFFTSDVFRNYCIYLNNTSPELSDKKTRRALAHLVDVDEIATLMEGGMVKRNTGVFNVNRPYYNKTLPLIEKDIDKAKSILTEEGWADTNNDGTIDKNIDGKQHEFVLDMYTTGSDYSNKIALLLQENSKKVGIKINIIEKKFTVFRKENIQKRAYDLYTSAYNQDVNVDDPFTRWHSSKDTPTGPNAISYQSDEADKLMEQIRETYDEAERKKLYLKLQEVMYDDQPLISLYHPQQRMILSKNWKGTFSNRRPGYFANTFINN